LYNNFYLHPVIAEAAKKSQKKIETLYNFYLDKPSDLPERYKTQIEREGLERTVCDYIAGMTDRYCLKTLTGIEG
jgi:dGTPase